MKKILIKWIIIFLIPVIFICSTAIWTRSIDDDNKLSKEYADKLVFYPDDEYNSNIIEGIKDRLSLVPSKYLKVLYDKHVFIRTIKGPLMSDAEYSNNNYVRENKSYYEKFTGAFLGGDIIISVDNTYYYSVEVHEVGHAIEHIIFNDISTSNEFKDTFNKEGSKLLNKVGQEHYLENSKEYFAETFNYYYSSYDTRKYLKERAPQTYKFIKDLESKKIK